MGNGNNNEDKLSNKFGFDITGDTLPKAFVDKMMETTERLARESGRDSEREENVCRLLASGMPAEEISLLLKIRVEEIRIIEKNNARNKIPEYTKTYKSRLKSREKRNK